jgi:hypothetical protein
MSGPTEPPHDGRDDNAPLACTTCGRRPHPGHEAAARLTWSRDTSGAVASWTCDRCSREHLRSIEGKLDRVWW